MQTTFLVTGANGMIGSAVVRALLNNNAKVKILSGNPEKLAFKASEQIEIIAGNLSDRACLDRACEHTDIVIHTASKNVDHDQSGFEASNIEGTRNLCDAAINKQVKRFIYTSTVGVYGHDAQSNTLETASTQADTPFSQSKVMAENIVLEANQQKHFQGIVLRQRFVIGEGDRFVVPALKVFAKKFPFKASGGKNKLSFVNVEDLANIICLMANTKKSLGDNPVFHVNDGVPQSYMDIVQAIESIVGFKKTRLLVPLSILLSPIKLYETLLKIDPETSRHVFSSIRLKLVCRDNYFSNDKLRKLFPDYEFVSFAETLKQQLSGK